LLLLMHLPLIEAYFIFFAPRTQPKVHDSLHSLLATNDQLAAQIAALDYTSDAPPPTRPTRTAEAILTELSPASPAAALPPADSQLAHFFNFTFKHRRPLNVALRQHRTLLHTSMRSLLYHPHKMLDFSIRRRYFKAELRKLSSRVRSHGGGIKLVVRRGRIFEDSYQQLSRYTNKDDWLRARLNITFYGEEGLDAGGLAREFYLVLSRAIFNADNALFKPAASL
jgi:E3 ubiquitin-protein ligase HUWE1